MFNFENAIKAIDFAGIDFLINVPATSMTPIYEHFQTKEACYYVTREEEGVALSTGIALGGKLPLLLIQQSGVGNMLNALFGLSESYEIYFPILVLDRGINDENPVQSYSSFMTRKILDALDEPMHLDFNNAEVIIDFKNNIDKGKRWFISTY